MFLQKATKYMQEASAPLRKINEMQLCHFNHDITYGNNEISLLIDNENFLNYYYRNKTPIICADETGRTLDEGLYIDKILEFNQQDCSVLLPMIRNQFNVTHSIHVVAREKDCQHLYSIAFCTNENTFLHWLVNHTDYLMNFINEYMYKSTAFISEAKQIENRITLPNYSNLTLTTLQKKSFKQQHITITHKSTYLPMHLSRQQSLCFIHLMRGRSAKEIAIVMKLSHRTVEHYIAKLRLILGCTSIKELIMTYYDQYQEFFAAQSSLF